MRTTVRGAVLVVVAVLAGCGGAADETEGTAGSGAEPSDGGTDEAVTLRMAHVDGGGTLDPAVGWFAERVAELSGGQLEIEVGYECCGRESDVEERLVEAVAAGDAELGWVGTRVFADLDVPSFQALTAPLLLDSYALQEAVLASDLPAEMLAGLEPLGVEGVAVVPGPLRKPISADAPLVRPADWQGRTVHAFRSADNAAALQALGATPTDVGFDTRDEGLLDGSIQGIENSVVYQAGGRQSVTPYVTLNVNLWPRTSALVANPDALAGLSETQSGWLEQAAADVVGRTGELAELDAGALADSCLAGARYALAGDGDLAALADALAPVYARLQLDPVTAGFLGRIGELAATVTPEPAPAVPDGCDGPAPVAGEPGDVGALNGTYTSVTWTADQLLALGVDEQDATNTAGTFAFTFADGGFELAHTSTAGASFGCGGSYEVSGDRLTVTYAPGDCGSGGVLFTAAFEVDGDSLRFSDVVAGHPSDAVAFGAEPWTRLD